MEEIVLEDGRIRNASFTDYLLPTFLDAPEVVASLVEEPDPQAPLGAKGVGEPPCISVTPAIVAAIRAATGRALTRVPVRPQDIVFSTCSAPGHGVVLDKSHRSGHKLVVAYIYFTWDAGRAGL